MTEMFDQSYLLLLSGIDIPMIATGIWMLVKYYKEHEAKLSELDQTIRALKSEYDRDLMDYKLEVADTYARFAVVREIEKRVVSHLLRIESKLDMTALKTEALHSRQSKFFKGDHHV